MFALGIRDSPYKNEVWSSDIYTKCLPEIFEHARQAMLAGAKATVKQRLFCLGIA